MAGQHSRQDVRNFGWFGEATTRGTPAGTDKVLLDIGADADNPTPRWSTVADIQGVGVGEANTASNQGAGQGLFKQKTGVDLEFLTVSVSGDGIAEAVASDIWTVSLDIGTGATQVAAGDHTHSHFTDTVNPHATDLGNLGTGTLAELNALVTDGTLDTTSDTRTPSTHGNAQHSATYITAADVTFSTLNGNSAVGTGATQVAQGSHLHTGVYAAAAHVTDTANPHSVTKAQVGLTNVVDLKVKLDATTAPGVSNDNTEGYAVGSTWVDVTNDKAYVALDVTTGAAVWTETTQSAAGASPGGSDTYVQFNDGGSTFGGDAGFAYNKTTDVATLVGGLSTDTITERTSTAGVTIDSVLLKDGLVDGIDVDALNTTVGTKIGAAGVTYENLVANSDVGTGATQVSQGDHLHTATYVPVTRTLTGANGIATIGDLSANRTIQFNLNGLSAITGDLINGAGDYLVLYDASASVPKKILFNEVFDGGTW